MKSSTICIRYLILQLHWFVSKIDKILNDPILTLQKTVFSYAMKTLFSYAASDMLCFKKDKVHHRMQREKLYNLQWTIYILYVLRTSKILSDQFPRLQRFYPNEDLAFSYFIFFSPNTFFFKETEHDERCSMKNSTNYKQQFILTTSFCFFGRKQISLGYFPQSRELVAQNSIYFETKRAQST